MSYLSGTPEQIAAWGDQARQLHSVEGLVIIGSVARTAIYAHFGWESAPLSLEKHSPYPPYERVPRDFDAVSPFGVGDPGQLENMGPHPVDLTVNRHLFDHPGGYRIGYPELNFPVNPEVLATRTRMIDGIPVRTFTVGTQFCLDGAYNGPAQSSRYRLAWQDFGQFAAAMRTEHPDEFLPDEAYASFIRLNAENKLPPR